MGLTYKGRSLDVTGAKHRLLHGSRSSSSRLRFVKSKQVVVDKSRAESSVSDRSSTLTSLSEPDVVSTTDAATATAVTAAEVAAIFDGFGAPEACCTANRRLFSVCNHFCI